MSLLLLLLLVLMVWALVEVAQADRSRVRLLSKPVWIILIVIAQPVGAMVWFLLGRPKEGVPGGPPQARPARPTAPWGGRTQYVSRPAPDDDPEFLANLKRQAERERRAREQQQRDTTPEPDTDH
ncbi:MAG: PLD nuclease N-terminal domain-containing protein [Sporichthyaceae bacterium]